MPRSDASKKPDSTASDLLAFIDASPSPWHAAATALERLQQAGYALLNEGEAWQLKAGGRYVIVRDDAALVAFRLGRDSLQAGFRIIGAHTDSPCLRIKPQGAHEAGGLLRLATEIYGGPILATYADRDLLLAGRVVVRDAKAADGLGTRLVRLDDSLVRLPNLPIHMNRNVNEDGLKLHKHSGLNLIFSAAADATEATAVFMKKLASAAGVAVKDILSFELCAVDAQPGAFFGLHQEFIAARQLDNLASCHAAVEALSKVPAGDATTMIALFDHEEVGSESRTGAAGPLLEEVLRRILSNLKQEDALARSLANSWMISADMAHAHHPAHPECYDSLHTLRINGGVALKMNAGHRYATTAYGEAMLMRLAQEAKVPLQKYIHRADLACGSTVGPICAARLGIRTVDIGSPMWAMHSCRESAGASDHGDYIKLMQRFLTA